MLSRPVSRRASLLIALAAASPWALAQNTAKPAAAPAALAWPTKPLKIIVGFPAGTSPDLTARAFSEPLSKALGQPVIVENKVGAGGNIGADAVAKARAGEIEDLSQLNFAELVNIEELTIDDTEPLRAELDSFVNSVVTGAPPEVPAEDGLAAVETATRIVEAIGKQELE